MYNSNIESILCDYSFFCCQTRVWQPPDPRQLPNTSLAATRFRENGDSGDFKLFGDIFQIWLLGSFICPGNLRKLTVYAYITYKNLL